jgi:hypothetical protein
MEDFGGFGGGAGFEDLLGSLFGAGMGPSMGGAGSQNRRPSGGMGGMGGMGNMGGMGGMSGFPGFNFS